MSAQRKDNAENKKVWKTPQLVVYGDIEKITGEKQHGPGKFGSS